MIIISHSGGVRADPPRRAVEPSERGKKSALGANWKRLRGKRVGAVAVRPRRAGQEAEFDDVPDQPDDRDEENEDPPARLVAVMIALNGDCERRYQENQADNPLKEGRRRALRSKQDAGDEG